MAWEEHKVRWTLDHVWSDSENAFKILKDLLEGNEELYKFEQMLETSTQ